MARAWDRAATTGEVAARHAEITTTGSLAVSSIRDRTDRIPRCRLLDAMGNRCTAEAAEVDGEVQLCLHHLALAIVMIKRRADEVTTRWSA